VDAQTVMKKTDKGRSAMSDQSIALSRLARMMLIMFDGVKPAGSIMKVMPGDPDAVRAAVEELMTAGCIEAIAAASAPVASAAPEAASAVRAGPDSLPATTDILAVRKEAAKRIAHLLGPIGDPDAMKIERCKDVASLHAALELAARSVANLKGKAAADDFLAHTRDVLV
jgi:hypothetical protein